MQMPLPPSSNENLKPLSPGSASVDDVEDFFNQDDTDDKTKDEKPEVKDEDDIELKEEVDEEDKIDLKDDKKKEKDEDKEDEDEEDEDKKSEEDEEVEIDAPPKKKAILAKYPTIFKDFPFIEKMLYRDKQYQELFGSFDDAKEAHEKVASYEHFETLLAAGNTGEVLKTIKEGDPKVFDKVVDN